MHDTLNTRHATTTCCPITNSAACWSHACNHCMTQLYIRSQHRVTCMLMQVFVLEVHKAATASSAVAALIRFAASITNAAGTTYVDPGATATDNVDGNITSRLSAFGVGAVDTSAPTTASTPYLITYDVSDSAGNTAVEGLREVIVACKSPTTTCTASDGTLFCSTSAGLCIESTTTTVTSATYPTIKLIGQAVLEVIQGTSYLACPTPQPTNVICDRCE